MSEIIDQPPPLVQPAATPVWEKVIADYRRVNAHPPVPEHFQTIQEVLDDMQARDKIGRERYGTPLTAHNGRDQLVDAYQELLDAAVYIRAADLEGIPIPTSIYSHILDDLTFLRRMISERAKK